MYVCSSEVAIRKRDPPFVNSGVGNIVTTLHCPQAHLEVSDSVTTSTTETSVTSSTIEARSDVFMHLDFSDSAQVTISGSPPTETLTQIIATNDSTVTFVSADPSAGIPYETLGTND